MSYRTRGSCQVRERRYHGLLQVAAYDGNKHLCDMPEVVPLRYPIGEMRITEGMRADRPLASWRI